MIDTSRIVIILLIPCIAVWPMLLAPLISLCELGAKAYGQIKAYSRNSRTSRSTQGHLEA